MFKKMHLDLRSQDSQILDSDSDNFIYPQKATQFSSFQIYSYRHTYAHKINLKVTTQQKRRESKTILKILYIYNTFNIVFWYIYIYITNQWRLSSQFKQDGQGCLGFSLNRLLLRPTAEEDGFRSKISFLKAQKTFSSKFTKKKKDDMSVKYAERNRFKMFSQPKATTC